MIRSVWLLSATCCADHKRVGEAKKHHPNLTSREDATCFLTRRAASQHPMTSAASRKGNHCMALRSCRFQLASSRQIKSGDIGNDALNDAVGLE